MIFKKNEQESKLIIGAILIIIIYLSPLFLLGENAHIRVHDNLDSNLTWYKVLAESGEIFGKVDSTIPQIINGLPRNAFGTEFSVIVWLYTMFPTMLAYGFSQAITRFIAFIGMYILLKVHFIQNRKYGIIRVGVSLAFALTPFWPSGMLSTLGMPLALWAFLNIRSGKNSLKNYLVLTLLPFYSSFVLGFFFFIMAVGVLWLVDFIKYKSPNFRFLLSIVYMTLIFLLLEYRLVHSFLFSNIASSRDDYFHARLSLWRVIRLTFKNFILGHTHVMTVHGLFILPVLLVAVYLILTKRLWFREKLYIILLGINFVLSFWYAFWFYKGWVPLTERFHFLDTFNFARFHFLRPLLIYLGFALGLKIIWDQCERFKSLVYFFVIAQLLLLGAFNEEIVYQTKPSVKEFYAEELFEDIKEYINLPLKDYRVASIGIHPAVAQYNGFYTLDTYNNFYPLHYKYEFRKIIEQELAKNKSIKTYFDEWGGRCYIFSSEIGKQYMFKKTSKKHLENLQLNIEPFKELGGQYIFSAMPIDNARENRLVLEGIFESNEAAWRIYLYKAM